MSMPFAQAETLLAYKIIQLPARADWNVAETYRLVKRLLPDIEGEPVELRGQTSTSVLLVLYARLRGLATEIIYRPDPNGPAFVVYSIEELEHVIRPADVKTIDLPVFDEAVFSEWVDDEGMPLTLDWSVLGRIHTQSGTGLYRGYLSELYRLSPHRQEVFLRGDFPPFPALLTLNWFWPFAKKISYDGFALKI